MAEKVGFEPTRRVNALRDFESRLFDHLSTSPYMKLCVASRIVRNALYYSTPLLKLQALFEKYF